MTPTKTPLPWLKPAILTGSLIPVGAILLRGWRGDLGPDPISQTLNQLGLIALVFLLAALACSPLKGWLGWTWPMRIRRMLGLIAFFYALLHIAFYTILDQELDWSAIWDDVSKRKFIFVGFLTFILMIPLAVTSTSAAVRWLGFPRWKLIHRLSYLVTVLAVLHFIWRVKLDEREPMTYAFVVAMLLIYRVAHYMRSERLPKTQQTSSSTPPGYGQRLNTRSPEYYKAR